MHSLILVLSLAAMPSLAEKTSRKIELFENGNRVFGLNIQENLLEYEGVTGKKSIAIKACNKKLVQNLETELKHNCRPTKVKSLIPNLKVESPRSVKCLPEGLDAEIAQNTSQGQYFSKLHARLTVLELATKGVCK